MQTILSPQLQEATQSLIDNLVASEPFLNYQQARTRLNQDSEAHTLLDRLSHSQANLRKKQADGGGNQAEIDSLRLLQQRVQRNSVIMDYAQSQQDAVTFLREINNEISQLLGVNFAALANHATC
jgi:cell fate (sporulation/competence/biofilm development) regulator YlbF (YheA/YmcA/DUF963 family)